MEIINNSTFNVIIVEDTFGTYTASLLDVSGGPIVNAPTLDEVKRSFAEAFSVSVSLYNLKSFISGKEWVKDYKLNFHYDGHIV